MGLNGLVSSISSTTAIDTSKILYSTSTTHPEPLPHPIIVLSLSQIDGAPSNVDNETIFSALLERLNTWAEGEVTGGYILIVLAAWKPTGRIWPSLRWWMWRWRRIPRNCRKNLKRLYIIHPSTFTRRLLPLVLPFLSPKSYNKLYPLQSLSSLYTTYGVDLSGLEVTLPVIEEESRYLAGNSDLLDSFTSTITSAASYISLARPVPDLAPQGRGYWGRRAEELVSECEGQVPPLLGELGKVILKECTATEGIFRRSSNSRLTPALNTVLDLPIHAQPNLPWTEIARDDPLLPPKMLLRFFSQLPEPIIPTSLYPGIRKALDLSSLKTEFISALSKTQHLILSYLVHLLHHLSQHESKTRMNSLSLAIVIAPVLIRGSDELEDAALCLLPGKTLPKAMYTTAGRKALDTSEEGTLVGLLDHWIDGWSEVGGNRGGRGRCGCDWNNLLMGEGSA